jgi:citronellol/citronellal dehydrogenase
MNLDGKVSLVTGGAGGIGVATAWELARLGSDIMIIGQRIDDRVSPIKDKIASLGSAAFCWQPT